MRRFMRKIRCCCIAVLLSALLLPAQAQESEALVFTRIERNPRAAAMAGAGAASLGNAAYSGFGKAAVLAFMDGTLDAGAGFQLWAPGDALEKTTNLQAAAAARFGAFGLSLAAAYQSGVPAGDFAPSDRLAGLGFAWKIAPYIAVGLNLRYAGQSLSPQASVNGYSADLSVAGLLPGGISLSAGLSTLGSRVKGSQEGVEFVQPACLFAAALWHKRLADAHELELALDGEYAVSGAGAVAFGAEYAYAKTLFVRTGYRLAAARSVIPSHLAAGIGVQFAGFRIEAAWMGAASYAAKNNTLGLGLGYRF